ncbi:hypothetical protein CQW23_29767 [Capsicum baccatum]|uniref:DOMON domain-containing protein n=1 Tax=Capsicum baccatum TaxID=33114 RepID=A0A2G2VCE3_CAPBA|nr:hypothetical protein CQW23_29767 [Capsicum baccatum]
MSGGRILTAAELQQLDHDYPMNMHAREMCGLGTYFEEPLDDDVPTDDDRPMPDSDVKENSDDDYSYDDSDEGAPNLNSFLWMGFSREGKMMGSSTIVGWVSNDSSSTMKRYYLGGQSPSEVVSDQGNLELVNIISSIVEENSRIYMALQLNTKMSSNRLIYSLSPIGCLPYPNNYKLSEYCQHISTLLDYNSEVGVPPITDLLLKIDKIHSRMHRYLDNFQNTLSTCLKKFVDAQVSLAVIACLVDKCETEEDPVSGFASDLDDDNSNSTDNFEIPPAMLEHSVGISLNSIEFTALMVFAGCKCDIDTTMGTDNVDEKVRGRK